MSAPFFLAGRHKLRIDTASYYAINNHKYDLLLWLFTSNFIPYISSSDFSRTTPERIIISYNKFTLKSTSATISTVKKATTIIVYIVTVVQTTHRPADLIKYSRQWTQLSCLQSVWDPRTNLIYCVSCRKLMPIGKQNLGLQHDDLVMMNGIPYDRVYQTSQAYERDRR